MKNLFTIMPAWLLCVSPGCAIAQQLVMPAIPVTVEVHVRDPDGRPVEGATVSLTLPRYGDGEAYQHRAEATNEEGIARLSGIAQQDYVVVVNKVGYYTNRGPHHDADPPIGVHKVEFELRPVRNPVQRPISRTMDRLRLPAFQQPLGFDLEAGDWIAPHGRGRISDLIFTVDGHFRALNDYDQILTVSFSQPGDGIQPRKYPKNTGPAFKFPYEAPEFGYEPRRVWRRVAEGNKRTSGFDTSGEMNYIFRVRTELDEAGRVKRALYGVVFGEIILGGNPEIGRIVRFTYALNPDWTPNIEFDPATVRSPLH